MVDYRINTCLSFRASWPKIRDHVKESTSLALMMLIMQSFVRWTTSLLNPHMDFNFVNRVRVEMFAKIIALKKETCDIRVEKERSSILIPKVLALLDTNEVSHVPKDILDIAIKIRNGDVVDKETENGAWLSFEAETLKEMNAKRTKKRPVLPNVEYPTKEKKQKIVSVQTNPVLPGIPMISLPPQPPCDILMFDVPVVEIDGKWHILSVGDFLNIFH